MERRKDADRKYVFHYWDAEDQGRRLVAYEPHVLQHLDRDDSASDRKRQPEEERIVERKAEGLGDKEHYHQRPYRFRERDHHRYSADWAHLGYRKFSPDHKEQHDYA